MILEFCIQVIIKETSTKNKLDFWQERKLMSRNFILFQLVRFVRDLFQFNDLGILLTSNNQGNFHLK